MPALVRRRPSLDLRKAAKAAEDASKFNSDSFLLEDSSSQHSDPEMDIPRHKLANLPSRQKSRHQLRLATSSPVLHQQYQSDEEQPSPTPDDIDGGSEYLSCSEEEYETDSEEDFDFDEDFDTPIALPVVFVASVEAIAMSIHLVGPPKFVDMPKLAPMAKRTVRIARPESASFTTLRRFKAPSPTTVRASFCEPVFREAIKPPMTRNFSTPLQRSDASLPSQTFSGSSPSSSLPSLDNDPISDLDEADLLIRESDEIMDRSKALLAGTEWDLALESHIPTTYREYDPFALQPPVLIPTEKEYIPNDPETPGKGKGWGRLGFKSRLMAAGRKVSKV
ncbi:hypothetical protein MMC10_005582 [Thelotrema lepadinum]|nr:hypothetical protein [Thelotrema lepadinum]